MVKKEFNITGTCFPDKHYMVNIDKRIKAMRQLVEQGKYFVLNRARQYGKTTTLNALETDLQKDYYVVSLDFQVLDTSWFESSKVFAKTFSRLFIQAAKRWEQDGVGGVIQEWKESMKEEEFSIYEMFLNISSLCDVSERPVVLMIDEVDRVSDKQGILFWCAVCVRLWTRNYQKPLMIRQLRVHGQRRVFLPQSVCC